MNVLTYRSFLVALFVCVLVPSTGCVSRDKTDLENYFSRVLSRPGGRIDPLPPIKPYERYLYRSGDLGLRDPFRSFFNLDRTPDGPRPPECDENCIFVQTHTREELEQSELDSLRMVGTLENDDELWGIVRDPTGAVHRVRVGNYMGTNYGKILNIQEERIDLRELIKDAQGSWEERQASLALSED